MEEYRSKHNWLAMGICAIAATLGSSQANPAGELVRSGTATFDRSVDGILRIDASDRSIIQWENFSIAAGELTHFAQPGATSSVLNRVTGGIPSYIHGNLQANGRVFLINPNGILVGPGGRIDTAGFVASTLDVSDAEFLAGGDLNFVGDSQAKVTNLGTISASEGDVFLFARQVENAGTITAPNGTAGLGAGTEILLKAAGEERIIVKPSSGGQPGGTGVDNSGVVQAMAAELKAAGGNLYALAIKNSGTVEATAVARRGGRVFLTADGGNIENSGTIEATNGDDGGEIVVQAGKILQNGEIRADGQPVLIAQPIDPDALPDEEGDSQDGGSVKLLGSERVTLAARSVTSAQAGSFGNGGEVLVRSMDTDTSATLFLNDSLIDVSGGTRGGHGGFADVSARGSILFEGDFDLGASEGYRGGNLLIDPVSGTVENMPSGGRTPVGNTDSDWDESSFGENSIDLQQLAFDEYPDFSLAPGVSLDPRAGGSFSGGRFGPGSTISLQFYEFFNVNDPFDVQTATGSTSVNLLVEAGVGITIDAPVTGSPGGFISFNTGDFLDINADVKALGSYTPGPNLLPVLRTPPELPLMDPATWDPAYQLELQSISETPGFPGIYNSGSVRVTNGAEVSTEQGGIRMSALEFLTAANAKVESGGELRITGLNRLEIYDSEIRTNGMAPDLNSRLFVGRPPVYQAIRGGRVRISGSTLENTVPGGQTYISSTYTSGFFDETLGITTGGNGNSTIISADGSVTLDAQGDISLRTFGSETLTIESLSGNLNIITQSEFDRADLDRNSGNLTLSGPFSGGAGAISLRANNGSRRIFVPEPGDVIYNTTIPPGSPPDAQFNTYPGEPLNFFGDGIVYRVQIDGSDPTALPPENGAVGDGAGGSGGGNQSQGGQGGSGGQTGGSGSQGMGSTTATNENIPQLVVQQNQVRPWETPVGNYSSGLNYISDASGEMNHPFLVTTAILMYLASYDAVEGVYEMGPLSQEQYQMLISQGELFTIQSRHDLDNDGIPDHWDLDRDNDGILDPDDSDIDGDNIPDEKDPDLFKVNVWRDLDGDGIHDELDDDLDGDGIENESDRDLDGDGILNSIDPDIDGDGILNIDDLDMDGDGAPNNPPFTDASNPFAVIGGDHDMDGDGISNTDDPDIDGDGILNDNDMSPNGP